LAPPRRLLYEQGNRFRLRSLRCTIPFGAPEAAALAKIVANLRAASRFPRFRYCRLGKLAMVPAK